MEKKSEEDEPKRFPVQDRERFESLLEEIEEEFDKMKWVNNLRKNVAPSPCFSMTFGEVFRPFHGRTQCSSNTKFPKVYQLLLALSKTLGLANTSFTINKNLECLPHRDKNNVGESVIVSLGMFWGGRIGRGKAV